MVICIVDQEKRLFEKKSEPENLRFKWTSEARNTAEEILVRALQTYLMRDSDEVQSVERSAGFRLLSGELVFMKERQSKSDIGKVDTGLPLDKANFMALKD